MQSGEKAASGHGRPARSNRGAARTPRLAKISRSISEGATVQLAGPAVHRAIPDGPGSLFVFEPSFEKCFPSNVKICSFGASVYAALWSATPSRVQRSLRSRPAETISLRIRQSRDPRTGAGSSRVDATRSRPDPHEHCLASGLSAWIAARAIARPSSRTSGGIFPRSLPRRSSRGVSRSRAAETSAARSA